MKVGRLKVGRLKDDIVFLSRNDFEIERIDIEREFRLGMDVIEPEIVDRLDRNRVDILENFFVTKSMLALGVIF